jgi:hypothetical protein
VARRKKAMAPVARMNEGDHLTVGETYTSQTNGIHLPHVFFFLFRSSFFVLLVELREPSLRYVQVLVEREKAAVLLGLAQAESNEACRQPNYK